MLHRHLVAWLRSFFVSDFGRPARGPAPLFAALAFVLVVIGVLVLQPWGMSSSAGPAPVGATEDCTVRSVQDGDTVTLACAAQERRVRLWGIDAPELGQGDWGRLACSGLTARLRKENVRLEVLDTDQYGRTVGRIWLGKTDIGLEQVHAGRAAVYREFNNSSEYTTAEAEARRAGRGIWEAPGAQQTPWLWRRLNPR